MSLLIWLPLNGNLDNQGLSPATFSLVNSSGGISSATSGGKIVNGRWIRSARTSSYIISDQLFNLSGDFSMCCWAKVTGIADSGTANGIITNHGHLTGGSGITMKDVSSTDLRMSINTGTDSNNRTYCTYYGTTNIYNQWHHLCVTYDRGKQRYRMYVDGKPETIVGYGDYITFGDNAQPRPFCLFAWSTDHLNSEAYRPPCELNDVRVYDQLLTPREIKEIAKGLVAHWPMKGMGSTNYLKGGGKYTEKNPLVRNVTDSSPANDSYVYYSQSDLSITLPVETSYTFVCETQANPVTHAPGQIASSSRGMGWFLRNSAGNHWSPGEVGIGKNGERYWTFGNVPAGTYDVRSNLYSSDGANYTTKAWNMRMVRGYYNPYDGYSFHANDEQYSKYELTNSAGEDLSGYGNNGTVTNVDIVGDSARGGRCGYFNGSSMIGTGVNTKGWTDFTMAAWVHPIARTPDRAGVMIGNIYLTIDENGYIATYAYGKTKEGYHTSSTIVPLNKWTHIAGTWNNATGIHRIYMNGQKVGEVTSCSGAVTNDAQKIEIGAENSSWRQFKGSMADLRLYTTALSADDIKELYNTPITIAKTGTLMATELVEYDAKESFNKNGVVTAASFMDKHALTSEMRLTSLPDSSVWARIHHLDLKTNKDFFTAAQVAKYNKDNRYSRMAIAPKLAAPDGKYEFMLTYPQITKYFPAGYTRLNYIEATGTQWINTGVTGHARWEFDMQFTNTTKRQLMGYWGNGDEYWGCQTDGKYGLFAGSTIGKAGNRDLIVHNYLSGAATLWAQNVSMSVGGNTSIPNQYQLFTIMGTTDYSCHAKMWECKCIQNKVLVRHFLPAQRNSDGAIGLLDVVNNVFYGNSGSGTFVAGYKTNLTYVDYLESSGTQYIDTGIKPNQDTRIVVKAALETPHSIYGVNYSGANFNMTGSSSNGGVMYYYWANQGASPMTNYFSQIHTFEQDKNICRVDGALYHTYTYTTWSAPCTLYLFARNNGTSMNDSGTVRIYSCQLYDNGTLVRDFVPCINNGVAGLYDKVNKVFYSNMGTGNFIAGPEKDSLPLYNRWQQTSSPDASAVAGFQPIQTSWPAHNAGIRKHGTACVYNCDSGDTWYAPIGQTAIWEGGIPAANGNMQLETELWMRIDRKSDVTNFTIQNYNTIGLKDCWEI